MPNDIYSGGMLRRRVGQSPDEQANGAVLRGFPGGDAGAGEDPFDPVEVAREVRDTLGDETPDEELVRADQQLAQKGLQPSQRMERYVKAGEQEAVKQRVTRGQLAQQLQDATERSRAEAEAETGAQTVFRVLGDLAGALRGGDPNAVSARVREIRERRRQQADQAARQQYETGVRGLEAEREDLLFRQQQEDRERAAQGVEQKAAAVRQLAQQLGLPPIPEDTPAQGVLDIYGPVVEERLGSSGGPSLEDRALEARTLAEAEAAGKRAGGGGGDGGGITAYQSAQLKQKQLDRESRERSAQLRSQRPGTFERQVGLETLKTGNKTIDDADSSIDALSQIDATLALAEDVLRKGEAGTGVISGSNPILFGQRMWNEEAINTLEQSFGNQWLQAVQGMRGLGQLSNKEGEALSRTTGGVDKDEQFNLEDLSRRRAVIRDIIARKERERDIALRNQSAVIERSGLGDVVQPRRPLYESQPTGEGPVRSAEGKPAASPPEGMVRVRAPDGSTGFIPQDQLDAALAKGAQQVE